MVVLSSAGSAYNRTRQAYLATDLAIADTHWTRLRGLLGRRAGDFRNGSGLWIVPCHGVHTLGMAFPIDVLYLDRDFQVIYIRSELRAWRFAPVRRLAASVLELPTQKVCETKTEIGDTIDITPPTRSTLPK